MLPLLASLILCLAFNASARAVNGSACRPHYHGYYSVSYLDDSKPASTVSKQAYASDHASYGSATSSPAGGHPHQSSLSSAGGHVYESKSYSASGHASPSSESSSAWWPSINVTICTQTTSSLVLETAIVTTTLAPVTITSSTTMIQTEIATTTASQPSVIITLTSTLLETTVLSETPVETSTSMVVETFEIEPPTSTVAPPPGLTPIRSVYPAALTVKKRAVETAPAPARFDGGFKKDAMWCSSTKVVTVLSTQTTSSISTIAATSTTIVQSVTSITTSISTLFPIPEEATTVSYTTQTTTSIDDSSTSTTVVLSTSTTTVTLPTPTYYAACGPENILDTVNGEVINSVTWPNGFRTLGGDANRSAYDCCVACLLAENCAGAHWDRQCFATVLSAGTCDGSLVASRFSTDARPPTGWYVSNSQCGQWQWTG